MAVKFKHGVELDISTDDLCAILTDNFCDNYTSFANLIVVNVAENAEATGFTVEFGPKPDADQSDD